MLDVIDTTRVTALPPELQVYVDWQERWTATARKNQIPQEDFSEYGFMAGRGFGKTRIGAEWLGARAVQRPNTYCAVVAPTYADVKHTCFEGESGLLSVIPELLIKRYNSSDLVLELRSGTMIRGFTSEKPARLRGPQHEFIWCFVAGTMVSTPEGPRAIETLKPGDVVLTRDGAKRVQANAGRGPIAVGEVSFSNGVKLVGTGDHPVYHNSGWTKMSQLQVGGEVCVVEQSSSAAPVTSAASVVSTWQPKGQQYVYCLKVEGAPEYFANGVLVHNCDELAAWQNAEETWDMAMMGLRLGKEPQVVWTTTPRPVELVRKLIVPKPGRVVVSGSTFDNAANLPDRFFEQLEQYEGTTIGRQELYGEMIDPEESGVIKRSWLKLWPAKKPLPAFDWIIMSLDTAFTEATRDRKSGDADYTACSVWGVFQHDEKGYAILLDCWQEQLGMPDLIKRVKKEMNNAYGDDQDVALIKPMFGSKKPLTSGRKPDILLIEDKGSGISLRQMLEREGILAHAYNPGRADKLARLHVVSPVFARRRVFLPESDKFPGKPRVWADPLVAQLCSFTGKGSIKHDDFVDSTTQAMRLMMDKGLLGSLSEKKPQEFDKPPPKIIQNPYGQ